MLKSIDVPVLEKWRTNFTDPKNKELDTVTKLCLVSLDVLQRFIDEAKINSPGFNGVRIDFIRYAHPEDQLRPFNEYVQEVGDSGFSQVTLAFVPVKNFDPKTLHGEKALQADGKIHTLAICHPADWPIEKNVTAPYDTTLKSTYEAGGGLCPPKCNGH